MGKSRLVFMGTPDFAVPCLDKLVLSGFEIAAVVTQPDRPKGRGQKLAQSPVKEYAVAHGFTVLQPEKIKTGEFIDQLATMKPDVIVVVAFGQFLPQALLDLPQYGCINVHASLLPKYRGAAPIHWAIINGEKKTGVTTMRMDRGMDTGDMLLKAEIDIRDNDTTGELHDRLKSLGADLLVRTLDMLAAGEIIPVKQSDAEASYAPLLKRDTERIDWDKCALDVHNLIRGLNPWPGAFCRCRDKILKVWLTEVAQANESGFAPGTICGITENGLLVATGKGAVKLLQVQPESKRRMASSEFARGYGLNVGEILG